MNFENKKIPPYFAVKFLKLVSDQSYHSSVIGDVEEIYSDRIESDGWISARMWIWRQVFSSFPVFLSNSIYRSLIMFRNYLKVILRNLRKNKAYSLINISGLAVGMACCLMIMTYINFELSYDRFHENAEDIYRVALRGQISGRYMEIATLAPPHGPAMIKDCPEVENAVRFNKAGKKLLKFEDKIIYETGIMYSDNSVFDIFSFELLEGDPLKALTLPHTMVITPEAAQKFFGDQDPIGRIIKMDDENFTVTGIIQKPPKNSHLQFNILASFETLYKRDPNTMNAWFNFNYNTYIRLSKGTDSKAFEAKIDGFLNNYIGLIMRAAKMELHNFLQPLDSIHLRSNLIAEISQNGDIKYIYVFSGVGFLILILACINFMNLSTARSAKRAKEVGMRKVMGAERKRLFYQFIGESLSMSIISLMIALILVKLTLPFFSSLAAVDLKINYLDDKSLLLGLLGITLIPGILAGVYPAVVLSGFRPVQVLKSGILNSARQSGFRRILVLSQFSISIALIIGTGLIFSQLNYLKDKDLGFNREHVLVIQFDYSMTYERIMTLKKEINGINGVIKAAAARSAPGEDAYNTQGYFPEGRSMSESVMMENFSIDPDYIGALGIEIIEGRNFSGDISTDPGKAVLINETAVKKLEWENAIGKTIREILNTKFELGELKTVGVFRDFHQKSLHSKIEPLVLDFKPEKFRRIIIKIQSEDLGETVKRIEDKWRSIEKGKPFEYFFLDESFDKLYRAEERLGRIISAFTLFALFIGCLGLFGLASFIAEQRTREIGVRKVLGSNVISIVYLLCREFVLLILLANFIAWPLAYFALKYWLSNFPYQAPLNPGLFISAGLIALGIAILTVSYQSIKTALSNPVNSLRYE